MAFVVSPIMDQRPLCSPLDQTLQCSSMTWNSPPWLPMCTTPRCLQETHNYYLPARYKIRQKLKNPRTHSTADAHRRTTSNRTQTWQVLPPREAMQAPRPLEDTACPWPHHQVDPSRAIHPLLHCHQAVKGIRHSLRMGMHRQCRRCLRKVLVRVRD